MRLIGVGNRIAGLVCLVLLAGCQGLQPDFTELYRSHDLAAIKTPPVVIVPGLLGSRLVDADTGEEVWPGSLLDVALGTYRQLAVPLPAAGAIAAAQLDTMRLQPAGITETEFGRDFYGQLIDTLVNYGGYVRFEPGAPVAADSQRRVYIFDYDWRQDNVTTVRQFHDFIQQIRADYADPTLKVDVIAHSMGGLMARYYLRFGTEDVLNDNRLQVTWQGADAINKMILLGTPNLGSVSAIEGFIRGQSVGLRRIPPQVVATLPSTYQLFPHRIVRWLYDTHGSHVDQDQFDVDTWRTFQWNIFAPEVRAEVETRHGQAYYGALVEQFSRYAERARRFSWALTVCPNYEEDLGGCPDVSEPPLKLVVFGGNCSLTPARWILEGRNDQPGSLPVVRFSPAQIRQPMPGIDYQQLMYDPGDGTVTKPSLLARDALSPNTPRHAFSYFPLAYSFLLCEEHATLTGNAHFQANLLDVLLTRALPWELHKDHAER
ncbi:MAG: hypothetical protein AAF993_00205 [Pseudomonadota bacterium]